MTPTNDKHHWQHMCGNCHSPLHMVKDHEKPWTCARCGWVEGEDDPFQGPGGMTEDDLIALVQAVRDGELTVKDAVDRILNRPNATPPVLSALISAEREFEARQIFIIHQGLWDAMQRWADDHRFYLHRIPDGASEDGRPFFCDDEETTPTYAFVPKEV